MATIKLNSHHQRQFGGAPPYGNLTVLRFALITNAAGIIADSNAEAPAVADDEIVLGELPAGMNLADAQLFVLTGATAGATGNIGFRYKDGEDHDEVPQDAEYFFTGADLAAAGRTRAEQGKLVTLPKDAYLILTAGGTSNEKDADVRILVTGELTGPL